MRDRELLPTPPCNNAIVTVDAFPVFSGARVSQRFGAILPPGGLEKVDADHTLQF